MKNFFLTFGDLSCIISIRKREIKEIKTMKYVVVIETWNGNDRYTFDNLTDAQNFMNDIEFNYEEDVYMEIL